MRRFVTLMLIGTGLLAGCSDADAPESERQVGALAAAQAYADALADKDVDSLEQMTDPAAAESATFREFGDRALLAEAEDGITDPWVKMSGRNAASAGPEYTVAISYHLRELVGGGEVEVRLVDEGDPTNPDSWIVTRPLLDCVGVPSYLKTAYVGSEALAVDVASPGYDDRVTICGYPGGYLLDGGPNRPGVEPVWLALGATNAPTWFEGLEPLVLGGEVL